MPSEVVRAQGDPGRAKEVEHTWLEPRWVADLERHTEAPHVALPSEGVEQRAQARQVGVELRRKLEQNRAQRGPERPQPAEQPVERARRSAQAPRESWSRLPRGASGRPRRAAAVADTASGHLPAAHFRPHPDVLQHEVAGLREVRADGVGAGGEE